jgi:hypothetical protein
MDVALHGAMLNQNDEILRLTLFLAPIRNTVLSIFCSHNFVCALYVYCINEFDCGLIFYVGLFSYNIQVQIDQVLKFIQIRMYDKNQERFCSLDHFSFRLI